MDIFQTIVGTALIVLAALIYIEAKKILFIVPHKKKMVALHEEIKLGDKAKGIRLLALLILIIGIILVVTGILA